MVILEINSESMFKSIIFKKTQKNTNNRVSTDLSVFDCALFVRFLSYLAYTNSTRSQQAWFNIALHISETASQIERKVHVMLKWPPPLTKKATTTNRMKSNK